MSKNFAFLVKGKPQPKQRPRMGKPKKSKNGSRVSVYTPKETKAYEQKVMLNAMRAKPTDWPLDAYYSVTCSFHWSDARSRDVDNTLKSIKDALNGVAYIDDKQVRIVKGLAAVQPVAKGEECAIVVVELADEESITKTVSEFETLAESLGARSYLDERG